MAQVSLFSSATTRSWSPVLILKRLRNTAGITTWPFSLRRRHRKILLCQTVQDHALLTPPTYPTFLLNLICATKFTCIIYLLEVVELLSTRHSPYGGDDTPQLTAGPRTPDSSLPRRVGALFFEIIHVLRQRMLVKRGPTEKEIFFTEIGARDVVGDTADGAVRPEE